MFIIDNNLSPRLTKVLQPIFPNAIHVADAGLAAVNDNIIWSYAKKNHLHILTKDSDFVNILHLKGFPPKVIRLNCGNVTTQQIITLLKTNENLIKSFIQNNGLGLLVIS
jgi:predicted nuclease of predicted toxin-antitoxin system